MIFPCALGMAKKPTYDRCFLALNHRLPFVQRPSRPSLRVQDIRRPECLTEAEVVQRGLARPELEVLARGRD
jgi:hypothetical protein